MKNHKTTDWFVLNFIICPNCNGKLVARPKPGELVNVFCEACNFACRLETIFNGPHQAFLDTSTKQLEKLLTDKTTLPPFILHFKWSEDDMNFEKAAFFPFIALRFLKDQGLHPITLLPESESEDKSIFFNMFELPSVVLYDHPSDEDLAETASKWVNISTSFIQRKFRIGYARAAWIQDKIKEIRRKKGIIVDLEDMDDDSDTDEDV